MIASASSAGPGNEGFNACKASALTSSGPLKICVLDDCRFERIMMRRLIGQLDLVTWVEEAASADEMRSFLEEQQFGIFVVDYVLSSENGLDAIRTLRGDDENGRAGVILVSGNLSPDLAVRALKTGSDAVLGKKDLCVETLNCAIAMARVAAQLREEEARFHRQMYNGPEPKAPAESSNNILPYTPRNRSWRN